MPKAAPTPWKQTCELRPEIRAKTLTASDFAVDLHKVINGWPSGTKPFYCDPDEFFSTTYATQNLRQFCKVVLRRLAGESGGEPVINVAQTFGGGKSHTLTALYFLTTLSKKLPKHQTPVKMILNETQLPQPPQAVVAAVSFDHVDWKAGGEAKSPSGQVRSFRMPWNLIAWQLLGQKGIDLLQRDESQPDYDTPPSDTLWAKILQEVEAKGTGGLILIDEFLMWAHDAASPDPTGTSKERGPVWYDRLKNFFQKLAQAVQSSKRSCLVVSLLATDPAKNDEVGRAILDACNGGLNRQASPQSPVEKDDLAELLRRRMFAKYPENLTDRHAQVLSFWDRMKAVDPARAKMPDAEERLKNAYPFHPDLLDRFFGKWTSLDKFQRTRGVLQTFAMALRDAEAWDDSPLVSAQVFLPGPKAAFNEALLKLALDAQNSQEKNPPWPNNLKTELPRASEAQKAAASTLTGREIEAACVASFIFSQPIGEQAEIGDLRWLLGATCDMPAVLNHGLIAWAKASWYLEECEATEAGTGVPKFWRLGPKPNLNQVHHTYKLRALNHAKGKFDELAEKCQPLYEGCVQEGVKFHKLPSSASDVDDDGQFRLVVLGANHAGVTGDPLAKKTEEFLRTHSSLADSRTYQNVVLTVIPSQTGLQQAEQHIADWLAWGEIKKSNQFKELDSFQQETVGKREKQALQQAQTSVRNAYELVAYLHTDGSIQTKKITMGAQSLFATLMQEKALRLFKDKIDADTIMPAGLYPVWPPNDASVRVSDLYSGFGREPRLPKLLNAQTVTNTIADAVRRGVLAVRCPRSDGSEQWFWKSRIEMADWEKNAEAWLPSKCQLKSLNAAAVIPDAFPGLWPATGGGVELSTLCSWFDGANVYQEETQPGYPPEPRPIPKVDYKVVHQAVAKAVENGDLWLVFGNDSVFAEKPVELQLDAKATLFRKPEPLSSIDFLPAKLSEAWTKEAEPQTTVSALYAALKKQKGKPWPHKPFLDGLNAALGQGFMQRCEDTGSIVSLTQDAAVKLIVKTTAMKKPDSTPTPSGRATTGSVSLTTAQVQTLSEEIADLTKTLAGCDVQFDVSVSIKPKPGVDLSEASKILEKVKPGWRF